MVLDLCACHLVLKSCSILISLQFVEGIITIGLGIIGYFLLPDFPDKNKFLSREQTVLILKRVREDRGDHVPDEITTAKVLHHLSDWTLWAYG
jgi:hypothetical protein